MSKDVEVPPNNGAVHNIAKIIKTVISSAAEAELGGLYINAREAVPMYEKNSRGVGASTTKDTNTN